MPDGDTFFNQEPLGDPDEWELRPLAHCPASETDEADFTIFEVLARNPDLFRERRELAIERARVAASEDAPPGHARAARRPRRAATPVPRFSRSFVRSAPVGRD